MPVISSALLSSTIDLRAGLELALERRLELLVVRHLGHASAGRQLPALGSTCVMRPSLAPARNSTSAGLPSSSIQARARRLGPPCWPLPKKRRGIVGMNADSGPREACAAGAPGTSAPSGVKRSAAFGTSSASSMFVVTISAVAVMPGRSSSSELSTSSTVS